MEQASSLMTSAASMPLLAPSVSSRVIMLDNAKAVLIVCVVLYHTAVVYTSADRSEVRHLRCCSIG